MSANKSKRPGNHGNMLLKVINLSRSQRGSQDSWVSLPLDGCELQPQASWLHVETQNNDWLDHETFNICYTFKSCWWELFHFESWKRQTAENSHYMIKFIIFSITSQKNVTFLLEVREILLIITSVFSV